MTEVITMNLDTLVASGTPPWQPTREAHDVEVWQRYDCPMAGTYTLQDQLGLFTIVADTSMSLSVWAYVPITKADEAAVRDAEFESSAMMDDFIESLFAGREAVFALARNQRVWKWARQQVGEYGGLLPAATESISEIMKSINQNRQPPSPEVLFRAELAQAEITTHDLVDA
jgi:hypothetical protein